MQQYANGKLVSMSPEEQQEVAAAQAILAAAVEAQQAYRVFKLTFIQRQTPEEAAKLEVALGAEEPKMRLMYNAAEYFLSDDSLFAYLHWIVAKTLGTVEAPDFDRADELLAPHTA